MKTAEYLKSIEPGSHLSSLRAFHTDIVELRAAGCTLAQIVEFLRLNGLTITLSSVGKYLQKHAVAATSLPAPPRSIPQNIRTPPLAPQSGPLKPGASEPPGFKSTEQLRAENPTLPRTQINKLYAQQYNQPVLTADEIEDLKRKYPPPAPRTAGT
ncbi:UNVERIFIED_ORG: hypothetical protein ABIC62_005699 [Burkholderia sp. 1595]|uniref:Uncharacterized protein n=1 Tax=Paraburkholderia terricola TaxID=169427 RepID=A0ABU1LZP3_9BURK|nr:hypothetical protein [Paraburkholderia terricola]MDR6412225.1 hypothetical protein [Paraburkholderia terricola]